MDLESFIVAADAPSLCGVDHKWSAIVELLLA